jgi:hypothetical protein
MYVPGSAERMVFNVAASGTKLSDCLLLGGLQRQSEAM